MTDPNDIFRLGTRGPFKSGIANAFAQHTDDLAVAARSGTPIIEDSTFVRLNEAERAPEMVVCERCDVPLSRLNPDGDPDGEFTWIHSRAWENYDHDPIPAYKPRAEVKSQCDFCSVVDRLTWTYEGNNLHLQTRESVRDYGNRWAACNSCVPYIDAEDLDGLMNRVMSFGPLHRQNKQHPELRHKVCRELMDMWGGFFRNGVTKIWIGPPRQPAKLNPRLMPKLLIGLTKFWSQPDLYEQLCAHRRHNGQSLPAFCVDDTKADQVMAHAPAGTTFPRDAFDRFAHHIRTGLDAVRGHDGDMFWVSKQFTAIATLAAKDFDDCLITAEQLPAKHGFVVFEDPIGEIPRPDGHAGIRAITWTPVPKGIWVNLYFQGEDADPYIDVEQMRQNTGHLMSPNPGMALVFNHTYNLAGSDEPDQAINIIRIIFATWLLLTQPGVAARQPLPVDKKAARAYQRTHGHQQPDVTLIDLRRRPPRPTTTDTTTTTKNGPLEYRRYTRGHWKRQFFGPKRGGRKLIYISPYISGPEDAPIRAKTPTVKVLR